MQNEAIRAIELEFTILEFYSNYVISRVRENEILSKKQTEDLVEVCSDFYKNKPFVYLSQRVNNYNVDPTIYLNIGNVENLRGIGIVTSNISGYKMANFEQNFSNVPFSIFTQMEDAIDWVFKVLR